MLHLRTIKFKSQNVVVPIPNILVEVHAVLDVRRLFNRGGHAQLFFESAIAIPQFEGSTSAIAIPQLFKEMLLRNRNSAIAIFSEARNVKSAT